MHTRFPFAALLAAAIIALAALPLLPVLDSRFVEKRLMVELGSLRCEQWGYLGPYRIVRAPQACEWHSMMQRWQAEPQAGANAAEVWVRGAMPLSEWQMPDGQGRQRRAVVPGDEHGILHSVAWKNAQMLLEHDPAGVFSELKLPRETGSALLSNMCAVASASRSEDELRDYQKAAFRALREFAGSGSGAAPGPEVLPVPRASAGGRSQL